MSDLENGNPWAHWVYTGIRMYEAVDWAGRHVYLSTACLHAVLEKRRELHKQCGQLQHERGDETAPHCKHCDAPCVCPCHAAEVAAPNGAEAHAYAGQGEAA